MTDQDKRCLFRGSSNGREDNRRHTDRRTQGATAALYSLFMKRRKGARRTEDRQKGYYVDIHEPILLAVTLGILLLCVTDGYLTLVMLHLGGEELNPIMRLLIEKDIGLFFAVKYILTSLCLIFTIIHKNFRLLNHLSGYHILSAVFLIYLILVNYEVYLLMAVRHH